MVTGLEIMAGQQTMSGQNIGLTGQSISLPVIFMIKQYTDLRDLATMDRQTKKF
jgi:hypothetical protein